ncbi:MAG: efflux RND transporter periplasmic adaptor subunit [Phycisphaerales bacterium]|nr:MAG: efflux RND transporter periplasmic adaptor subunit [Phycisphaerales bacterium]
MAHAEIRNRVLFGLALVAVVAGATLLFLYLGRDRGDRAVPETARPVLAVRVERASDRLATYPARVRAQQELTIEFEVQGVVKRLPVVRGQRVAENDLLAELDLRDFQSRLDASVARHEQAKTELEAITNAFERGAATQMEVTRARTAVDLARAERELDEKALEDATLRAPFDGLVADIYIDLHQPIRPSQRVLRLLDTSTIRVEVNVHESRAAFARHYEKRVRHTVRFDFLPDAEFDAELIEYTTEAERTTQTFVATLEIEPPEGALILPGMTATVIEYALDVEGNGGSVTVPPEAVWIDGQGNSFVWVLEDEQEGAATARRVAVEIGTMLPGGVELVEGPGPGTLIATAGLRELRDGQRVRPVEADRRRTPDLDRIDPAPAAQSEGARN